MSCIQVAAVIIQPRGRKQKLVADLKCAIGVKMYPIDILHATRQQFKWEILIAFLLV